jgi:hypothetical protein
MEPKPKKLLDQVSDSIRRKQYSLEKKWNQNPKSY